MGRYIYAYTWVYCTIYIGTLVASAVETKGATDETEYRAPSRVFLSSILFFFAFLSSCSYVDILVHREGENWRDA